MPVTVGQILELLEEIAPAELAEDWDNIGLLVGNRESEVTGVLCALDLNQRVLDEAVEKGAQLIVTHHPILFHARRDLREDDVEGRLLCGLVRAGIAHIAMHTNFDNARPGVNDALAETLGLTGIQYLDQGMRIGFVDEISLKDFAREVRQTLGGSVRIYGNASRIISRVAVLGGAGEDFADMALSAGADVYVTGEMGYHKGIAAVDAGLCVIEAGHAATENPAISLLVNRLRKAVNDIQYNVNVYDSAVELFL